MTHPFCQEKQHRHRQQCRENDLYNFHVAPPVFYHQYARKCLIYTFRGKKHAKAGGIYWREVMLPWIPAR